MSVSHYDYYDLTVYALRWSLVTLPAQLARYHIIDDIENCTMYDV